jgi:hypothetical protein
MHGTAAILDTVQPAVAGGNHPERRPLADTPTRLAGIGAIGFAAVVVLQNVIRGGSAPTNDASADEVLAFYADHRSVTFVLVATFVLGGACLALFLGGAMRRMIASSRPALAFTGLVGAISVIALFTVVVACEVALSGVANGDHPDLSAIGTLFALHNAIFSVLMLAIAVALLGLGRAGVAAGMTPVAFERLAPAGAVLLGVAAMASPAIAVGEAMPVFGIGVLGFAVWLAFLVATGLRLVRTEA